MQTNERFDFGSIELYQQYRKIHESIWRDVETEVEQFATKRAGKSGEACAYANNHVWNNTVARLYLEIGLEVAKHQTLSSNEQALNSSLRLKISQFFPSSDQPLTQLAHELALKVLKKQPKQTASHQSEAFDT